MKQPSLIKASMRSVESAFRQLFRPLRDGVYNWRFTTADRRFLVLRDSVQFPSYYNKYLGWLGREYPDVLARFELRVLSHRVRDWSRFALLIHWFPDPLLHSSPKAYRRVKALEAAAQAHNIPVINPVDSMLDTAKSTGARIIGSVGIRTARIEPIHDVAEFRRTLFGLELPLLIREDRGHGGHTPMYLVRSASELHDVPLEQYVNPIAVEFIDTRHPRDGFFRRYRYFAAGEHGRGTSLHVSPHWEVRGQRRVLNEATIAEELDYLSQPDPNHEILQQARKALNLDFVAFDYSYDREGRLVVWEANTMPGMNYPKDASRDYLRSYVEQGLSLATHLYLQRAGLEVPPSMVRDATTFVRAPEPQAA